MVRYVMFRGVGHLTLIVLCVLNRAEGASLLPQPPSAPTSTAECDAYSKELFRAMWSAYREHSKCIEKTPGGAAAENAHLASYVCGVPACQQFHDAQGGGRAYDQAAAALKACYGKAKQRQHPENAEEKSSNTAPALHSSSSPIAPIAPIASTDVTQHRMPAIPSPEPLAGTESVSEANEQFDQAYDMARDLFQRAIDADKAKIERNLKQAKKILSANRYAQYKKIEDDALGTLSGVSRMLSLQKWTADISKCATNSTDSCRDLVSDGASDGFEYVLEKLAPRLAAALEAPIAGVTTFLDSTSTQTPAQDIAPFNVIQNPAQYSFTQRLQALQWCYQDISQHPQNWSDAKLSWLYKSASQIYSSADNPNINLQPR